MGDAATTLNKDGRSRPPHLRSFRDGWRHLRFLLLFSPRWLFLYPGLALLAIGLFFGTLLIGGPVNITPTVQLDEKSFLAAAMCILLGIQAVNFAIIGRRFASRYGFIPRSATFDGVLESLTLERILIVALVLVVVGLGAVIWGVAQWAAQDFGPFESAAALRAMILALTSLVAGLQLAMSAFMASMIEIPLNERRVSEGPREDRMVRRAEDRR
jgi:hypothetical protein